MLKKVDRMVGYEPDEREQAIRKEVMLIMMMGFIKQRSKVKPIKHWAKASRHDKA